MAMVREALRLRISGLSVPEIAERTGIPRGTVHGWMTKFWDADQPLISVSERTIEEIYAGQRYEDDPRGERYGRPVWINPRGGYRAARSYTGCAGAMCAGEG